MHTPSENPTLLLLQYFHTQQTLMLHALMLSCLGTTSGQVVAEDRWGAGRECRPSHGITSTLFLQTTPSRYSKYRGSFITGDPGTTFCGEYEQLTSQFPGAGPCYAVWAQTYPWFYRSASCLLPMRQHGTVLFCNDLPCLSHVFAPCDKVGD